MINNKGVYMADKHPNLIFIDTTNVEGNTEDIENNFIILCELCRLYLEENRIESYHITRNTVHDACKFLVEFNNEVRNKGYIPPCIAECAKTNPKVASVKAKSAKRKRSSKARNKEQVKDALFK